MDKKLIALAVTIVIIAAGLAAALVLTQGPAEPTVRVGFIAGDIHHLPYAVANDLEIGDGTSMFKIQGLNVTGKAYANGGAIMQTGFKNKEIDIAYLGAAPAISQHLNLGKSSIDTVIVAQVNEEGSLLVADPTIDSASDLVGKRVATPGPATIQYLLLKMYLNASGINPSDVDIIDLGAGLMRTYMEKSLTDSDHISAFIVWEPVGADVVEAGVGHVLATSHDIWPHHPCCVIAVDRSFAEANPNIVKKFLSAHKDAIDWINAAEESSTSAEYAQLITTAKDFTAKNDSVVGSALTRVSYSYNLTEIFNDSVITFTENLIAFGIVQEVALTSNGNTYSSIEDFAEKYVDDQYL
ncbi:MAG: ABC transporter substrate-binding protein [Thermoplasmata archaeon]|nr:ABC transporter substrate-binding protein [Thermoplasmata archaeon]